MGNADAASRRGNESDYYVTPFPCIRAIIESHYIIQKNQTILDPCCGSGVFGKVFEEYGVTIEEYDIMTGHDFMEEIRRFDLVICNPPYSKKNEFIKKALSVANDVFMILPCNVMNYNIFHREFLDVPEYMGKWLMTPKFFMTTEETENPKRGGVSAYAWFYWSNDGKGRKGTARESFERYIDLNRYFKKG